MPHSPPSSINPTPSSSTQSPHSHSTHVDRCSSIRACEPCKRKKRVCNGQRPCNNCDPSAQECMYVLIAEHPRTLFANSSNRRLSSGSACETCRRRKTKCDGGQPCNFCAMNGIECVNNSERRRRSIGPNGDIDAIEDRLKRIEALVAAFVAPPGKPGDNPNGPNADQQGQDPSQQGPSYVGSPQSIHQPLPHLPHLQQQQQQQGQHIPLIFQPVNPTDGIKLEHPSPMTSSVSASSYGFPAAGPTSSQPMGSFSPPSLSPLTLGSPSTSPPSLSPPPPRQISNSSDQDRRAPPPPPLSLHQQQHGILVSTEFRPPTPSLPLPIPNIPPRLSLGNTSLPMTVHQPGYTLSPDPYSPHALLPSLSSPSSTSSPLSASSSGSIPTPTGNSSLAGSFAEWKSGELPSLMDQLSKRTFSYPTSSYAATSFPIYPLTPTSPHLQDMVMVEPQAAAVVPE
ncbi:hypothetical protein BC938DRAFT_477130 [Jimgerdemannia flammicorona]|uniref:Zn(2)-C6 fungal-type domain-containing protein n=1 Tax=Jimgerdemannia flammicorona TaxID=994334 RepID=A0A433PBU6_9FUNG|nr:hypothetical protein BC938DRAFT_477130 [Jimgerdemannia flammicorona]